MDVKQLFQKAVEEADGCINSVQADQLDRETPCSEWNLQALLNHMVYELLWMPELLVGKTIAEVGSKYEGDVLKGDHVRAWDEAVTTALAAVQAADLSKTVHVSYGDIPVEQYISEMAQDMAIHGWDVGQSINCSVIIDKPLAKELYRRAEPRTKEFADSGMFGKPVEVADDAEVQTKLLAILGRSVNWQKHADKDS